MIGNYLNPAIQVHQTHALLGQYAQNGQPSLINKDTATGRQASAYEGAKMVLDGRLKNALTDRKEPSVTWLGKTADYLIDKIFKRTVLQSQPVADTPIAAPESIDAPISTTSPKSEPVQSPAAEEPVSQPISIPTTIIIDSSKQTCGPNLFDVDSYFGSIYLQSDVPSSYDCTCVATNSYVPAKTLKVYYGSYEATNIKSYTFSAKNITATFTSANYLPKGLVDNAAEILNPIFETINSQCTQSDYQNLQVILGVTIPGGAIIASLVGLAIFYKNRIMEACGGNQKAAVQENPAANQV